MFGNNPVAKPELHADGKRLQVVQGSPFYTIQGEGPYAGEPSVFVRLHGCGLRCHFCDTQFSDPTDPVCSVDTLVGAVLQKWPFHPATRRPLVVVTGGEPMRQAIGMLCARLALAGCRVQIETSGVLWQPFLDQDWARRDVTVVVSPKTPAIHADMQRRADAFKYVVRAGGVDAEDGLPVESTQVAGQRARLSRPRPGAPVFLSPMDEYAPEKNTANRAAVAQLALTYGYRAGVQLHKVLEITEP